MYRIKIIQAYAPTTGHKDEEVEKFYDDISTALKLKSQYTYLIGDFNAKLGKKESDSENAIGPHGLGIRNSRGDMLLNFLHNNNLYAMNTFFHKKPQHKWTWRHPDSIHKNEYDYIITNRKDTIKDVAVLNRFKTGSDHRLVRARCVLNIHKERCNIIAKNKRFIQNDLKIESLKHNQDIYQEHIKNTLASDDELDKMSSEDINHHLTEAMNSALQRILPATPPTKPNKLSQKTMQLINQRREMDHSSYQYSELQKSIRTSIRKDLKTYEENLIEKAIEKNSSRRSLKLQMSAGKKQIFKLLDPSGKVITNREELLTLTRQYYEDLYSSKVKNPKYMGNQDCVNRLPIQNVGSEEIPDVSIEEIESALRQLKNRRAPGEDSVIPEMLKYTGEHFKKALVKLFTKCILESTTPAKWNNAVITLLFKKGDIRKLDNYRPISLLSHIYKLFTRVIMNRLQNKLDAYQPREQAGFRSGYSTCDHLQTIKTVIEKCHEYQKPIIITFVDYEKAFDSIETWAIEEVLADTRVDERYISVLKHLQAHATACVNLHKKTEYFALTRGVRQGDTISPKLFNAALENIFKKLNWDSKGIKIDGEYLSHLRFADDLVLFCDNVEDVLVMIDELKSASLKVGLKMNVSKTKILSNMPNIAHYHLPVEVVTDYIYLGHKITLNMQNQTSEVDRRITQAWVAFGANSQILRGKVRKKYKLKVFEQCVVPVFTYGAETITFTKKSAEKFRVAQRAMERAMLGISLRDRKTNEWIRNKTRLKDIISIIAEKKWRWAGHIARMESGRWTRRLIEWRPRANTRPPGRPPTRWVDDIRGHAGQDWMKRAQDRRKWKDMEEAYVQKWTNMG